MENFFAVGRPGYFILMIILLSCIALLLYLNHRQRPKKLSRAEVLQKTYAVMTRTLLDAAADDEVVNAVIANLMGKLKKYHPDPLITMPQLSHQRSTVYFTWLLSKEYEANGIAAYTVKPTKAFVKMGIESLESVGAVDCAAALRDYMAEPDDEKAGAYAAAYAKEQPLVLCKDLIRNMPEAFLDAE